MSDKRGQGSLVAVILASVIGTIIIGSTTQWFLSMNKTMDGTNDRLEAMTIAMSEWQRLEHMSLDELEANRENYKTPYKVGDNFTVGVNLGEQGFFDNGTCNALTGTYAGENANCFKDTTMTVYDKDGKAMYTTRSLPLSVSRDSFPEGTILPYTGDLAKIPHGWVLCDGTNGTPDLRGRFLEGTGTTTGEFKMAGLPNIEGRIVGPHQVGGCNIIFHDSSMLNNAFFKTINDRSQRLHGPQDAFVYDRGADIVSFSASNSNPLYGRSETVQPNSYTVFYIMKTNKDFHYNHTNGIVMPEYYTKDEVDNLLKENIDKEHNYNENNYLPVGSNKYVHNDNTNYGLSMAYSPEDEMLHAYVDGTEVPFGSKYKPQLDTDNGYVEFDNGFVIQYGVIHDVSLYETWHYVVFPKPFKNKVVSANVSVSLESGSAIWTNNGIHNGFMDGNISPVVQGKTITLQGMKIGADLYGQTGAYGSLYWTAYGY